MLNELSIRVYSAITGAIASMKREEGQDLIEYALLGGLIAVAILAAAVVLAMTGGVTGMANGIADCIDFDAVTTCPV